MYFTGGRRGMIKVFEAFAGVGSQRMALKNLGIPHEVVAISEIDKFAIASYEAIHGKTNNLGDISKIEGKDIPDHDLFTYSFPCFTGDSLVLTNDGYKRIDEINIGDMVLTHMNRYKKVTNIFNQGIKDIVSVKGMAIHDIRTTENHKFLTRERYRLWNNDRKSYDRMFHNPKWVEVKDLTRSHYLGLAINQKSELPVWNGYTNSWNTGYGVRTHRTNFIKPLLENNDFWWLMGRYVADGWHRSQGGIVIAVPDSKLEEFENRVNKLFDYSVSKERMVNKIHIPIKELELFTEQFGYYAHGKKISSDVLNLPANLLKPFIEGYFSGDGSYSEGTKLYKCTSTSEELIYGIGQCVAKVHHRPYAIYKTIRPDTCVIEGRTVNQRDTYSLTFKMVTGKQDQAFYDDGYIWFPFDKFENNGKETVYDIEVEDDHSFTVFNTIVHNCQDISLAGRLKGFEKGSGTQSSLLWECNRVIELKKPKYLLLENVRNLVSKKFKPYFDEWLNHLESLGYKNYWQVLNAKDYGIPQNRERVFVISILGKHEPYVFPEKQELQLQLKDVLEKEVDEKFYLDKIQTQKLIAQLDTKQEGNGQSRLLIKNATKKGYLEATDGDGIDLAYPNSQTRRGRVQKELSSTLKTADNMGTIDGLRIRKLTPLEYWRLMGFKDLHFYKAQEVNSNLQLYKQAGNSIVVPVLEGIFRKLI